MKRHLKASIEVSTGIRSGVLAVVAAFLIVLSAASVQAGAVELPDGRVYEQVTPVDKNGGDAQGNINLVQAARDGNGITFYSMAGFPGAEGAQDFPILLATRSATTWPNQSLYPPASLAPLARVWGWNEDLTDAYVTTTVAGVGSTLYHRDNATHALRVIAEGNVGEVDIAGTSTDGALMFFESTAKLTPAAVEGKSNLYFWERASGDLGLVSVFNDEQAPTQGAFAGPYDWFITKTTTAGGADKNYYTQPHHAISRQGDHVYFTAAGTGQLYLRQNPTEPQSPLDLEGKCVDHALACTIHVSTSRKTNGQGPGGTDSHGPLPAAFRAATPDGTRVFFTSNEELTDDASTGPEARIDRSKLDGSDIDPSFLPVAAKGVAIDSSYIYWTNPKANAIGRANLDGTGINPSFITGANNPQGVTIDSNHVYWSNAVNGVNGTGTIGRANLDGTGINQSFITGANKPQGIAVSATHIYWANAGTTPATRRIGRANLDGTGINQSFITIGGNTGARALAVSATHIYWANPALEAIGRANLDGTEPSTGFILGLTNVQAITLDGSYVYWVSPGTDAIGRAKLDGTEPEESFMPNVLGVSGVAVDALHLYPVVAGDPLGNDLYRYDADTEELIDISLDDVDAYGAEVRGVLGVSNDGSTAYFTANGVLTNTPNNQGKVAVPGNCDLKGESGICSLYHWHEGDIAFIAQLDASGSYLTSDGANWQPGSEGAGASDFQATARVSDDGETLLFRSTVPLTGYDNVGECFPGGKISCPEFFLYSAEDGELNCVSCDPTGAPPTGEITLRSVNIQSRPASKTSTLTRNLSADGNRVFFESPDSLTSADINGETQCPRLSIGSGLIAACQDVYMWEANGTGSCDSEAQNGGCLYLLSKGTSPEPSYFADASLSGDDAFIYTTSRLVGQDKDNLVDIYDARVGGGLASQNLFPTEACEGEACKPGATPPPATQSPGTSSFSGTGNQKPAHTKRRRQSKKRRHAKKQRNAKKQHKSRKQRQVGKHR